MFEMNSGNGRYGAGTSYISRPLWYQDVQTVNSIMTEYNGFDITLDPMTTEYGLPITSRMFSPGLTRNHYQVSLVEGTHFSIKSLRSILSTPENFIRAMENTIRAYKRPSCRRCGLERMCVYSCVGPTISEKRLQEEISESLISLYPMSHSLFTTKMAYNKFYKYLRGFAINNVVFAGKYVTTFYECHNLAEESVPASFDNIYFPCVVIFDSDYYISYQEGIKGGRRGEKRKRDEDCNGIKHQHEPPSKRQRN